MAAPVGPQTINVRQFLNEYVESLSQFDLKGPQFKSLQQYAVHEMNFPDSIVKELSEVCGTSTLTSPGHPDSLTLLGDELLDADTSALRSIKCQKESLELRKSSRMYKMTMIQRRKYGTEEISSLVYQRHPIVKTYKEVPRPNVIIKIIVFRPTTKKCNFRLRMTQELLLLGTQSLAEFRDNINCVEDSLAVGEFSNNPDLPRFARAKEVFPSGFFLIENTFYNDFRQGANCKDISEPIRKWAEKRSGVGPYKTATMEETKFLDLELRLGEPYLYQHQGDCEHVFIVEDIRIFGAEDWPVLKDYPIQYRKNRERHILCKVCEYHVARWVTRGSQLAPSDPCFFCDSCFKALHYNSAGQKVTTFQAFPFQEHVESFIAK